MALTFGSYASPDLARPLAIGAVVALTAVNLLGVQKTAWLTRVIVVVVLAALATVVTAALTGRTDDGEHRTAHRRRRRRHPPVGRAAVLRLRRLRPHRHPRRGGSRSRPHDPPSDPHRARHHPRRLHHGRRRRARRGRARHPRGRRRAADRRREAGSLAWAAPVVRIGGRGRLARRPALAARRRQPHHLRHGRRTRPAALARRGAPDAPRPPPSRARRRRRRRRGGRLVADVRGAIGFSSFAVLFYYAVANASAFTLPADERRWPMGSPSSASSGASCWRSPSRRPASSAAPC